jgi:hypothetical protein
MRKNSGSFARKVDVVLQVTEPAKESETVIVTKTTYNRGNRSAQNRARAEQRIARPEGTRIAIVASGEAGSFDYLLEDGGET